MFTISAQSTEYVRVPISATNAGAVVNPTSDTVQMACVAEGTAPGSGDWKAASWESDATTTPTTYYSRALVGPAGVVQLAVGVFDVYVKVTDAPEVPIKKAGPIRVTA